MVETLFTILMVGMALIVIFFMLCMSFYMGGPKDPIYYGKPKPPSGCTRQDKPDWYLSTDDSRIINYARAQQGFKIEI